MRRYLTPDGEDWHDRMKALQGLAPDEQINVLQVKELVDHITKYKIGVVFPESNLSRDSLEKVREGCGRAVVVSKDALYGDTLGGKDYLTMLEHNATVLEKNLNEH